MPTVFIPDSSHTSGPLHSFYPFLFFALHLLPSLIVHSSSSSCVFTPGMNLVQTRSSTKPSIFSTLTVDLPLLSSCSNHWLKTKLATTLKFSQIDWKGLRKPLRHYPSARCLTMPNPLLKPNDHVPKRHPLLL